MELLQVLVELLEEMQNKLTRGEVPNIQMNGLILLIQLNVLQTTCILLCSRSLACMLLVCLVIGEVG